MSSWRCQSKFHRLARICVWADCVGRGSELGQASGLLRTRPSTRILMADNFMAIIVSV